MGEEYIKSLSSTSQDDDQIFEDATSSSNQQEYVPEQQSSGEEEISGNRVRKRINPENLPENCLHVRHSRNKRMARLRASKWCSVHGCSVNELDKITLHKVKETWKPCLQWKTDRPF